MADAVHYQALVAIQTVIRGLGLTGIAGATPLSSDKVVLRRLPYDPNLTQPGMAPFVIVSLVPVAEEEMMFPDAVMQADDWQLPCMVTLVFACNRDVTLQEPELKWRQQVRRAFNNKRPFTLEDAQVVTCRVKHGPVLDLPLFRDANLMASPLLVHVVTREGRT